MKALKKTKLKSLKDLWTRDVTSIICLFQVELASTPPNPFDKIVDLCRNEYEPLRNNSKAVFAHAQKPRSGEKRLRFIYSPEERNERDVSLASFLLREKITIVRFTYAGFFVSFHNRETMTTTRKSNYPSLNSVFRPAIRRLINWAFLLRKCCCIC